MALLLSRCLIPFLLSGSLVRNHLIRINLILSPCHTYLAKAHLLPNCFARPLSHVCVCVHACVNLVERLPSALGKQQKIHGADPGGEKKINLISPFN